MGEAEPNQTGCEWGNYGLYLVRPQNTLFDWAQQK